VVFLFQMSEEQTVAVRINQDYCSGCLICYSICPYEAIKMGARNGKLEIDTQKCQVCGICYSACPASAIEILYYNYDSLVKYVENERKRNEAETLVLMCRGNSPPTKEVEEILSEQSLSVKEYIPLRLPCSGRVSTEFIFKVLSLGVKNVVSIQCEDSFCRFKEGAKINTKRLLLLRRVLEEFGFGKNTVRVVKYSRKAFYDPTKCVGCDKCVFICPYDAIEVEDFATPKILKDYCMGCGACALVCPHHAIQLQGFEFESVLRRYSDAAVKLKANGKSPVVLVFCCQWSEFSALDNPEEILFKRNAVIIEVPCFKTLDPVHVVNALRRGFDGVMAVVCPAEDCKIEKGRDTAERNMAVLKDVLKKTGLFERFEIYESSPRDAGKFEKKLDEFIRKVSSLSPMKPLKMGV